MCSVQCAVAGEAISLRWKVARNPMSGGSCKLTLRGSQRVPGGSIRARSKVARQKCQAPETERSLPVLPGAWWSNRLVSRVKRKIVDQDLRQSRFARYMASSARPNRSSPVSFRSQVAVPIEHETLSGEISWKRLTIPCSPASSDPGASSPNSSPPSRATKSPLPRTCLLYTSRCV